MNKKKIRQKDLKGEVFDKCARLILQMKFKRDRANIANALAMLYGNKFK